MQSRPVQRYRSSIVFELGVDPVTAGLVASLARPGGNLTGVSNLNAELAPKRLELLRELVPTAKVFGLLVNPANPGAERIVKDVRPAADVLGIQIHILHASAERDFDAVFADLGRLGAGGLLVATDGFLIRSGGQLGGLSLRRAMPTIFQTPEFSRLSAGVPRRTIFDTILNMPLATLESADGCKNECATFWTT